MGCKRFSPEFKEEAVRQVTEHGYSVKDVTERICNLSLLHCQKLYLAAN
jgi:transposase-like protein